MILKSLTIFRSAKDYKLSSEIAKKALILAENENNNSLLLEAYLALILSEQYQSNDKNIDDLIIKADEIFENFKDKTDIVTLKLKSQYYRIKGIYLGTKGESDLSVEYFFKESKIDEQLGKIRRFLNALTNISVSYILKGDFKKAEELLIKIIKKITDEYENKYDSILQLSYTNLGESYRMQGELDKSLEYLNKSLRLTIKLSSDNHKGECLANIAMIYLMKGDFELAVDNMANALKIFEQIKSEKSELRALVEILSISIYKNDEVKIKYYFEKITLKYQEHLDDSFFKINFLYAKALTLKRSDRWADKIEAQKIFKEIITKNEFLFFGSINEDSLLNYLDLLVEELRHSNSITFMQEIEQVNKKLFLLAESQHSYPLMVESMLFDAKINILKLEFTKARVILTQAQITAEEKGLKMLSQKISKEHDNLLNKMNQWENIINESISLSERLELANVEEILRSMIQKSYALTQESQDQGLILIIINSDGLALYSKKFIQETVVEEQVLAGLLTAINSFSQETFNTNQQIERIKQGENTVILKNLPKTRLNICYAFKGPSYFADKKVNLFISKIQNTNNLLEELSNYKVNLSRQIKNMLHELVKEVFEI